MKNVLIWGGIGIAALVAFVLLRSKTAAASPTASTGTAGYIADANALWNSYTAGQTKSTSQNVASTFAGLANNSNAFGKNTGSPGLSIGGSSAGGIQSSGSGAGVPVASTGSDLGTQTTIYDQTSDDALNGGFGTSDGSDFADDGSDFDSGD